MWLVAFIMNLHILLLHAVHAGLGGLVVYGVAEGSQWHEMEINKTSKASFFCPGFIQKKIVFICYLERS